MWRSGFFPAQAPFHPRPLAAQVCADDDLPAAIHVAVVTHVDAPLQVQVTPLGAEAPSRAAGQPGAVPRPAADSWLDRMLLQPLLGEAGNCRINRRCDSR